MTILRCLVILLVSTSFIQAQQLSLFTQYRENATLINPAAMESDFLGWGQNLTLGANYRAQWTGISGAPTTQSLRISYLNDETGLLLGGHVLNDQTGPTGFTGVYGKVGAVISNDPDEWGIAVALSGGAIQYRIDADKIKLRDPNDIIGMSDQSVISGDAGAGVYFYNTLSGKDFGGDIFYAGVSVPQVIGIDLTFKDINGDYDIARVRHYYGMLGLYHFFRNDGFIEPSLWIKYVEGAPINADFNIRYQTPMSIWIGTGVSTAGNFHFETGLNIGESAGLDNNFKIGYGFDYSYSTFGPSVGSTHELQVSFSFDR